MRYEQLLQASAEELKEPLVWQFPGNKPDGKIILANGIARMAGREVNKLTDGLVLVVMGPTVNRSGLGERVIASLKQAGLQADLFTDIASEPHMDTIEALLAFMRHRAYGAVVGVGGGSTLDVAKLAAHAVGDHERLLGCIRNRSFPEPGVPTVLLPTTSGTGSEVSPYSVLTYEGKKVFYGSPNLLATVAMVDPLLTYTMPPRVTAATAFDAMTHALEGAIGKKCAYTRALAVESTATIMEYLPRAIRDGEDVKARYNLALASVMGMMAYTLGGGLYAHSISYILTLHKNQPHGVGCGMALPYTLAFNFDYIDTLLQAFAARLAASGNSPMSPKDVIQAIHTAYIESGLPASLADIGFDEESIPLLAQELIQSYYRTNNPRAMSGPEAVGLLSAMYGGEIRYF